LSQYFLHDGGSDELLDVEVLDEDGVLPEVPELVVVPDESDDEVVGADVLVVVASFVLELLSLTAVEL